MSQQDGLDVQCERQGIRKHDSTSSGLNKWKNDLLFIETEDCENRIIFNGGDERRDYQDLSFRHAEFEMGFDTK